MLLLNAFNVFDEFENALADETLEELEHGAPSEEAKEAAARLVTAMGFCYLLGIGPDENDEEGKLSTVKALAAIDAIFRWVSDIKDMIEELPQRCAEAADDIEADELCADVLEKRMRIWAAEVTLSKVVLDAMSQADPLADTLNTRLEALATAVDLLDGRIRRRRVLRILARLANTALLANWRGALAEPYSYFLPYWLDGTLERIAKRRSPSRTNPCVTLLLDALSDGEGVTLVIGKKGEHAGRRRVMSLTNKQKENRNGCKD